MFMISGLEDGRDSIIINDAVTNSVVDVQNGLPFGKYY
jgi:hypothetical protein